MMNRPEQVPTHSKQILNDTVNVQEPLGVGRCHEATPTGRGIMLTVKLTSLDQDEGEVKPRI